MPFARDLEHPVARHEIAVYTRRRDCSTRLSTNDIVPVIDRPRDRRLRLELPAAIRDLADVLEPEVQSRARSRRRRNDDLLNQPGRVLVEMSDLEDSACRNIRSMPVSIPDCRSAPERFLRRRRHARLPEGGVRDRGRRTNALTVRRAQLDR